MEYMNEGELILAYTYDDIYYDLRRLIIQNNLPKFIETFNYVLSLDPNVFQNYPIFTRLLMQTIDYIDDMEYLQIIKYLLDNGLDLNQTHINPYTDLQPNITVFNKIIYRMCMDLNHMWDHDIDHDEWQIEVKESQADYVGRAGVQAIKDAGNFYKMRCPLDGEYKIGDSWYETH